VIETTSTLSNLPETSARVFCAAATVTEPNPSSLVSAPVSRSIPSASGKRHQSPGKVTLTPSEVEAARLSGISIEEYARQKLKYEGMRESGEYRDNRGER
jgi:hypothetical protein